MQFDELFLPELADRLASRPLIISGYKFERTEDSDEVSLRIEDLGRDDDDLYLKFKGRFREPLTENDVPVFADRVMFYVRGHFKHYWPALNTFREAMKEESPDYGNINRLMALHSDMMEEELNG